MKFQEEKVAPGVVQQKRKCLLKKIYDVRLQNHSRVRREGKGPIP